jgi:hypothetical protein
MLSDLIQKEIEILKSVEFYQNHFDFNFKWTVIVGKESFDIQTLANGLALGVPQYYILSAGENAPIFYFDKNLNKVDFIFFKGWGLGPRLPKQNGKGAKFYYVLNPDGEKSIVSLTHWPSYLFKRFLDYIITQYAYN